MSELEIYVSGKHGAQGNVLTGMAAKSIPFRAEYTFDPFACATERDLIEVSFNDRNSSLGITPSILREIAIVSTRELLGNRPHCARWLFERANSDALVFLLNGKIKPYVRMTRRGKYVKPTAQEYLVSQMNLKYQFKEQMLTRDALPRSTPLFAQLVIEHGGGFNNRDLTNEAKAVEDAAQGIVYRDDRWIDKFAMGRFRGLEDGAVFVVGVL